MQLKGYIPYGHFYAFIIETNEKQADHLGPSQTVS